MYDSLIQGVALTQGKQRCMLTVINIKRPHMGNYGSCRLTFLNMNYHEWTSVSSTLSSQANAKRGFWGCHATVNVGALHCTSHILSPVSTIALKMIQTNNLPKVNQNNKIKLKWVHNTSMYVLYQW